MKCIVGGTFDIIHAGHAALLAAALAFDTIQIGLTSDSFAGKSRTDRILKYEKREANLRRFLEGMMKKAGVKRKYEIVRIDDAYGFAPQTDADAIIVSHDTEKTAEAINRIRAFNLRKSLRVISVPLAYAEDYVKISSTRIRQKRITLDGKRLKPVVFALGTVNPSKKQGLEKAAKKLFKGFRIKTLKVDSGISEQPFDDETIAGAINRAKAAYFATDADFGIGFESGIFGMGKNNLHDIAVCAIFDGEKITLGNSMGFQMPPQTMKLLSQHKDLGAVMEGLSGISKIGYKKGAIHYLSDGLLARQEMNEQAFLCAMIPRISETKNIFRYF